MKLTIIADDFTGSNDTGVQFAKKGLRTVVTTNMDELGDNILSAEVAVIDTESRFDSKETAYKK
ncbi:MAG: four-carbon acid sugar kinase family protein, partial [Erysipelothrix sp.]|nr:four-carbon acid sugar kinase family protein [Erysipelothrix sp.]